VFRGLAKKEQKDWGGAKKVKMTGIIDFEMQRGNKSGKYRKEFHSSKFKSGGKRKEPNYGNWAGLCPLRKKRPGGGEKKKQGDHPLWKLRQKHWEMTGCVGKSLDQAVGSGGPRLPRLIKKKMEGLAGAWGRSGPGILKVRPRF